MSGTRHDWARVAAAAWPGNGSGDRLGRMQGFVDCAWDALAASGVSWIGFYLQVPDAPEPERLVLGPRRNTPACSPIGLHGACGRCLVSGVPLVVRDVTELGANYIACDPRDRSELVLPCWADCTVWGVLDVDSHEIGCFSEADAEAAAHALLAWGLTANAG